MLLATILLFGALPQNGELARSAVNVAARISIEGKTEAKDSSAARELPSMPKPKVSADADAGANAANASGSAAANGAAATGATPTGATGSDSNGSSTGASTPLVAVLTGGE